MRGRARKRRKKSIHAFNKSGRHLEFSINYVIRGKITQAAKMATKDESSVDVDFAGWSYKKECFYFMSRGIFSLYNVFMGMLSKVFVQRYSWIDANES